MGCIRAKVVVFRRNCCIRVNLLFSGKNGRIQAKVDVFGQKWLYSGKVVVFGKIIVVFRQKWFYSGKVVVFRQKWL